MKTIKTEGLYKKVAHPLDTRIFGAEFYTDDYIDERFIDHYKPGELYDLTMIYTEAITEAVTKLLESNEEELRTYLNKETLDLIEYYLYDEHYPDMSNALKYYLDIESEFDFIPLNDMDIAFGFDPAFVRLTPSLEQLLINAFQTTDINGVIQKNPFLSLCEDDRFLVIVRPHSIVKEDLDFLFLDQELPDTIQMSEDEILNLSTLPIITQEDDFDSAIFIKDTPDYLVETLVDINKDLAKSIYYMDRASLRKLAKKDKSFEKLMILANIKDGASDEISNTLKLKTLFDQSLATEYLDMSQMAIAYGDVNKQCRSETRSIIIDTL